MNAPGTDTLAAALALVGLVVVVAALLSGLIERSRLPQVAVFLALGAALGPAGLGVLHLTLESPALRLVATLSLALVLFTDALTVDPAEVRQYKGLALLVLGPGTLATAALLALAGWGLLGLAPAAAALLGAALASTDPILMRGLLQAHTGPPLPSAARHALRLESGLNDVVLLPIVLVAMAFLREGQPADAETTLARLGIDLLLLGPGLGIAVGLLAVAALDLVRRRIGVRRDYESLYSLGVAFTAYAAAEAVHGSGFLAAFAAGITITVLDVELCECFVEYGQTTAEMALLFAFVLFGAGPIWSGLAVVDGRTLLFAAIALLARTAVLWPALAWSGLDLRSRLLVAGYGPRGLSALLLVLLPVFAGLPGSAQLFALCSLVVLLSVVLHGGLPLLLEQGPKALLQGSPGAQPVNGLPPTAVTAGPVAGPAPPDIAAGDQAGSDPLRLELAALRELQAAGAPVVLLDVRTERTYAHSPLQAQGALRLPPDHVAERAAALGLPRQAWLVAYCA
ncbi:MAG TPA: cation:proton antiporter [Chloroflexota bacterium]|nr:cation:proton antiporter [Chloroflexota bacterium]